MELVAVLKEEALMKTIERGRGSALAPSHRVPPKRCTRPPLRALQLECHRYLCAIECEGSLAVYFLEECPLSFKNSFLFTCLGLVIGKTSKLEEEPSKRRI
jgi:hypothetical protein